MVKNKQTTPVAIQLNQFLPKFIQEDLPDTASQIQLKLTEQLSILFDESQFRQVLINLIRNAIRHNTSHQPIEITVHPQATYIYIDVRDFAGVASQDLLSVSAIFQHHRNQWNWFRIVFIA